MHHYHAVVDRIIDGDTIDLIIDLGLSTYKKERVRLTGIDAPEMSTVKGKEVKAWLETLFKECGNACLVDTLQGKREKYGRYLATLYLEGTTESLNDRMIAQGKAVAYHGEKRTTTQKEKK